MQESKPVSHPLDGRIADLVDRHTIPVSPNERLTVTALRGDALFDSFATRYRVYCRERQFLEQADYPEGLETDDFDWFSSHIGVFDASFSLLGTVRLVPASTVGLPMDGHCAYRPPDDGPYGEISRLAVPRSGRSAAPLSQKTISLQLYRGLYQVARANGMSSLVSAMEPSLERLVRRLHFPWRPIGPKVDYYGWVRPYALNLDELDAALQQHQPAIYALFQMPLDAAPHNPVSARPVRDLLTIGGYAAND